MRTIPAALAAATLALACAPAPASDTDLVAEATEWVFEPCMEVAAALDVADVSQDHRDMGIKREHLARVMLASREAAIQQVVAKMKASASWEARRAAYPVMLKLCIAQFDKQ